MTERKTAQPHYNAVVVGARAAGAATAMLLARRGLKVLAVDRQDYGSDTLSTHALMRGAVVQLAKWGLLEEIAAAGTPAVRRTSFFYGPERLDIEVKPGFGADALYAPRRHLLDRVLVDAARRAGAEVHHRTALERIERAATGGHWRLFLHRAAGATEEVRADLLIGADGRHSTVARFLGVETLRLSKAAAAVVYGYFDCLGQEAYRWYYRPGIAAGAIPTNDGQSCVFASVPRADFLGRQDSNLRGFLTASLARAAPDLASEVAGAELQGRLRGFPGEPGYFRRAQGDGWALVGDAGYFKDPITAHGITDALRDAELLADAVASGERPNLVRYEAERNRLSETLFDVTDEIAAFDWSLEQLKSLHKALNAEMKREVVGMAGRRPLAEVAA